MYNAETNFKAVSSVTCSNAVPPYEEGEGVLAILVLLLLPLSLLAPLLLGLSTESGLDLSFSFPT